MAGLAGVLLISLARPLLPYALGFAAGAMIYVVFDDIIPEAHSRYTCPKSKVFRMLGWWWEGRGLKFL